MSVNPPGPSPIAPIRGPEEDDHEKLAKDLQKILGEVHKQLNETLSQNHLIDSGPNLSQLSENLIKLHKLAHQAARLNL